MSKRCPPEFRRKVGDLVTSGRRVARIATDLDISDPTIYNWRRNRAPPARALRQVWLTEAIRAVHTDSSGTHGTHGARRVHAERTTGLGIAVGHNAVEMLLRGAGHPGPTRAEAAQVRA
jgi:transposase-like protein